LPILVQALVFAALHGWGTPWGFVDLTWFGVVAGYLCVRTGGIEAAVALHVSNNVVSMVALAALGGLGQDGTAADAPWSAALVSMAVTTGYGVVVSRWAGRRTLASTSDPAPSPPRPAVPAAAILTGYGRQGSGNQSRSPERSECSGRETSGTPSTVAP
jgi:hypothetical protein